MSSRETGDLGNQLASEAITTALRRYTAEEDNDERKGDHDPVERDSECMGAGYNNVQHTTRSMRTPPRHSIDRNTCSRGYEHLLHETSRQKRAEGTYLQSRPPFSEAVILAAAATQSTQVTNKLHQPPSAPLTTEQT